MSDHNVGADEWRRTGVLTFTYGGLSTLKNKVTYGTIQQHLKEVYGQNFSYGTVVELCIPRNKRRRSAHRYHSAAKVTTRRARKGFNLRYNPDVHWSASLYKGFNDLEYSDGRGIVNINRDDAAGFRLDTLTTCSQYATPCVKDTLTTRTDYVNKYPSTLQTTSYSFSATKTTPEFCVGIVKAPKVHQKNPAQHAADLEVLEEQNELAPVFSNKLIDCIRVDGAMDEGPSHEEVQYWWTKRHLKRGKLVTLVSTRSAGSSYLNRVELQNGCLSRGHANTFIPSTLSGSCLNLETGEIDLTKLEQNMNMAIDAYIQRVDGCPCGDTQIRLFKGQTMTPELQLERDQLLVYLKGAKVQKSRCRERYPSMFELFDEVWRVRKHHMITGLPGQYIFMLKCCYRSDCPHPLCKCGRPSDIPLWYPNGPPVTHLPLPVVDPLRSWGRTNCETCKGVCHGHYKTKMIDLSNSTDLKAAAPVPSTLLKAKFKELKGELSDDDLAECAKAAILPVQEVNIWMEHLKTVAANRQRGAAKAAATRKSRKSKSQAHSTCSEEAWFCGTCGQQYANEMGNIDFWIGCDVCGRWFCCVCEKLYDSPPSGAYTCLQCKSK